MSLIGVIFVVFLLLLLVSLPLWPYSLDWGYGPSGSVAIIGTLLLYDWL